MTAAKSSKDPATGVNGLLTEQLLHSYQELNESMEHVRSYELPSMEAVERIIELCRSLMFPGWVGEPLVRASAAELQAHVRKRVDEVSSLLRRQVYRGLHHRSQEERGTKDLDCPECAGRAEVILEGFLRELPAIRRRLALDVRAHYLGDPAAKGTDEIIFCYPGLYVITVYRLAHALLKHGAELIPRMMTEIAHRQVGIDIHPGASIGESFFIDHGTGIVVGETTIIGNDVRVYQGVTLGALSVPHGEQRPLPDHKRHPTIQDGVIIYAGATILGGDTVIGTGAVIGGNCWVTTSVPPGAVITTASGPR